MHPTQCQQERLSELTKQTFFWPYTFSRRTEPERGCEHRSDHQVTDRGIDPWPPWNTAFYYPKWKFYTVGQPTESSTVWLLCRGAESSDLFCFVSRLEHLRRTSPILHPITVLGVFVHRQPVKHYQAIWSGDEMTEPLCSCFEKPGVTLCQLPNLSRMGLSGEARCTAIVGCLRG